jgi:hypothetical protein
MGHFIFCILHILALLFGFVLLFLTVPLHLIYTVVRSRNNPKKQHRSFRLPSILLLLSLSACVYPRAFDKPGLSTEQKQVQWAVDMKQCEEHADKEWTKYWVSMSSMGNTPGVMFTAPRPDPQSLAGKWWDDWKADCLKEKGWFEIEL